MELHTSGAMVKAPLGAQTRTKSLYEMATALSFSRVFLGVSLVATLEVVKGSSAGCFSS